MKKLALILFISTFSISQANASFIDNLKQSLRPTIIQIFGKSMAVKILGKDPNMIEIPEIPKIESDVKSIQGLYSKPKVEVSFKPEKMERYNYIFIQEMVRAVREVDPSGEEIGNWMNVLSQSGSREGVYSALVLDNTYMGLQNMNRLPSERVLGFTTDFLSRFVNKTISADKLAKVNFYVVKREIAERMLQVVDELFKQSSDDIYDWYAVFSSEFAQKYPQIMDNDVRKVTSAQAHRAWAKSVPDQFVKSEILIKLHRVFNFLQSNPQ